MLAHLLDILPAFLVASVILAALPGPATALFLHRSVRDGRKAGLAAVAGNEIGVCGWRPAAAVISAEAAGWPTQTPGRAERKHQGADGYDDPLPLSGY